MGIAEWCRKLLISSAFSAGMRRSGTMRAGSGDRVIRSAVQCNRDAAVRALRQLQEAERPHEVRELGESVVGAPETGHRHPDLSAKITEADAAIVHSGEPPEHLSQNPLHLIARWKRRIAERRWEDRSCPFPAGSAALFRGGSPTGRRVRRAGGGRSAVPCRSAWRIDSRCGLPGDYPFTACLACLILCRCGRLLTEGRSGLTACNGGKSCPVISHEVIDIDEIPAGNGRRTARIPEPDADDLLSVALKLPREP